MIIFGQKRKVTRLRLVADYRPICRGMRPHEIKQPNLMDIISRPWAARKSRQE